MVQGLNENGLPGYTEECCGIRSPSLNPLSLYVRKNEPGESPVKSGISDNVQSTPTQLVLKEAGL